MPPRPTTSCAAACSRRRQNPATPPRPRLPQRAELPGPAYHEDDKSPTIRWAGQMAIDFTRLSYFLAVAEELHFKRAADRLHITPPPLSKQIKMLDRELGGALFQRDYHQVGLTPLGQG